MFLGKGGLGRKDFLMKKKLERSTQDISRYSDFRQRKQLERFQAQVFSDLKRSKMACHQLDSKRDLSYPEVEWYWPEELLSTDKETEDKQSFVDLPDCGAEKQQYFGERIASEQTPGSVLEEGSVSRQDFSEEILEEEQISSEDHLVFDDVDETEDLPEVQE